MVNCHLNIDIDDFLHTPDGRWGKQITFSPKEVSEIQAFPYRPCRNYAIIKVLKEPLK